MLLLAVAPALAQLSPYATPHLFALPTAATTRLFGMGGFVTCVPDLGFANPAFAGTLQTSSAVARISDTDFDSGLNLRAVQASTALPLEANRQGLQITLLKLDTRSAGLTPGPFASLSADFSEEDLALHYGYRPNPDWAVGVGVSPRFRADSNLRSPLTGDLLTHFHSSAKFGFRLGAVYQLPQDGWAGFVFDDYKEDVSASGAAFPAPVSASFRSQEIALGVSRRLSDKVLAAVEWQQLNTKGNGERVGDAGFRAGLEFQPEPNWALRVGSNDGAFSAGVGAEKDNWSFQYAYLKDWNKDSVRTAFGDSDTHQFEVRYRW
jgi:hypothetical protein